MCVCARARVREREKARDIEGERERCACVHVCYVYVCARMCVYCSARTTSFHCNAQGREDCRFCMSVVMHFCFWSVQPFFCRKSAKSLLKLNE